MIKKTTIILLCLIFVSCTPKLALINGGRIDTNIDLIKDIYIFGKNEDLPKGTKILGEIETKGNFFTSEKYKVNEAIELIKKGTEQLGGNAVRIEEIKFPGPFKSKSYDIVAVVLLIKELPKRNFEIVTESYDKEGVFVKLYRPNILFGSGLSYPVYLNNSFIGGLDNYSKFTIILKDSTDNYYLHLESYGELYKVPIIIKDNVLYIKCVVSINGRPKIDFPEKTKGEKKFEKIKNTP